ncbi:GNAT family N-acetyltransferase [Eubacterium limosum]|uniref:GNAT family N-acetyltransferase n=2 Tax=Eubacterium limosum TaxID=1736 RepID=A0ABT5UNX6_EUBLI|nr:GNAT family N-acetyltransferase [Eubacterium limosum]MCB6571444.1 GNAT family N-acetyltransferase [Eubacterium limosum]MDE1469685.1 GNAT family N-acetyltransferase [Eubacterium limosum]
MNMILETERLSFREMNDGDFADLCQMLQDPVVMTAYEHAFEDEEARRWLENQKRRYREDGFGLWAVLLKETGEMIGQCGLTRQFVGENSVLEIGYLFKKDFWHKGYATEAATVCKQYAFEVLDIEEVYSIIRDTNIASQAVAKRNGMTLKGKIVKHYYEMDMPHLLYSAVRK